MKYNTARDHLILPEYGRNVQKMVDHAINIKNKEIIDRGIDQLDYFPQFEQKFRRQY